MSLSKVNSALVQAFLATGLFAQSKVQFENVLFTPPTGEPWAAVYFVPNTPEVSTLGEEGTDEATGFLQIDLNFPNNKGTAACNEAVDTLRNTFTAGKRFVYLGQELAILNCGRSQGRNANGLYTVSVTVSFLAQLPRNYTPTLVIDPPMQAG